MVYAIQLLQQDMNIRQDYLALSSHGSYREAGTLFINGGYVQYLKWSFIGLSVPNCHIKASTLVLVCIQQHPRTSLSCCASCYDCREERCGVVDNRQPSNSQDKIGLNVLTSNRRSSFSFYSSIYLHSSMYVQRVVQSLCSSKYH